MAEYKTTTFGDMLKFEVPEGCTAVILCVDTPVHIPLTVLLPHQVYRENLKKLLEKYPYAEGFTIIPFNSRNKIEIARKEI